MTKNSTSIPTINPDRTPENPGPGKITLAKIRQFARAYTFVPVKITALGGLMAN